MTIAALKEDLEAEIAVRVLSSDDSAPFPAMVFPELAAAGRARVQRRLVFRSHGPELLKRHVPPGSLVRYHALNNTSETISVRLIEPDGKVLFEAPPLFAPLEQFLGHVLDGTVVDAMP